MAYRYLTITTLVLLVLALGGCDGSHIGEDEREAIVRRSVEEHYHKRAPANNGYEFVSLKPIDTVLYKDNIAFRRNYMQDKVDHNRSMLEIAQAKQDSFPTVNFHKKITTYKDNLTKYEKVLAGIDSLETVLGDKVNDVASYTYLFQLKANNEAGIKTPYEYYVQTDLGFGVLKFTANKEELYPNPNDFPGYRDMAASILVDE